MFTTLQRIGSYEKKEPPSSYLRDMREIAATDIDSLKEPFAALIADTLLAKQDLQKYLQAQVRMNGAKNQLRNNGIKVPAAPEQRVAELADAYRNMYSEAILAVQPPLDTEGIAVAKVIGHLLRDCHILAERLDRPLEKVIAKRAKHAESDDASEASDEPIILEFKEGVDFVEAGENDETLTEFTVDSVAPKKKA